MIGLEHLLREGSLLLSASHIERPRHEARILLAHIMGVSQEYLFVNNTIELDAKIESEFQQLIQRRANREPMAYIRGYQEFYGLPFCVNAETLIPRPDSEILVKLALEFAENSLQTNQTILDLGVGSGCLLIAFLKNQPFASGVGVDVSYETIMVARDNAVKNNVSDRTVLFVGSWGTALGALFDIIVINPPYIRLDEEADLMKDVIAFEPRRALFSGKNGTESYQRFSSQLRGLLRPSGRVFVELAAGMGDQVEEIMSEFGLVEHERRQDLAGIERCSVFKLSH